MILVSSAFAGETWGLIGPEVFHMRVRARRAQQGKSNRCTPLLGIFLLLIPVSSFAQARWMPNGLPVCVVPGCSGHEPQICGDGAGGAVIAWDRDPLHTDQNIYVHRVRQGGALDPAWPPKGTPATRAPDDQYLWDLVPDGTSGAFVAWYDWPNYDIYAQHVLGDGTIAPGWPVDGVPVCVVEGEQDRPRLLIDGAGGVFIAWDDRRLGYPEGDIYAQHLNTGGTRVSGWPENGLAVCAAPGSQGDVHLVTDTQGGCVLVWGDGRICAGYGGGIFAKRISGSGETSAGWPVDGREVLPGCALRSIWGVVSDNLGGAYIGWGVTSAPGANDDDVFAVHILADGSVAPGWPALGYPVCVLLHSQDLTSVIADGTGGVLLAWYDNRTYPAVAYVQRLRPNGTLAPGWQENGTRVSDLPGYHFVPRLAADGHGGAYVAFEEAFYGTGHMQHLTASGGLAPGWPSAGLPLVFDPTNSTRQEESQIVPDGVGGAIVVWNDSRDIWQEQLYAQRYIGDGPTPVLVSLASVQALPDHVEIIWLDPSLVLAEATVQRRHEREEWIALGRAIFDGAGRLRFEDRGISAGARYAYRLSWIESGVERFSAETWVDVPAALAFALDGARPNPATGPLAVVFTLAKAAPATLELMDVSGRQVIAREVGSLGAGRHEIRLGECGCTPAGMYLLRLTQAGHSLIRRVAVVR